MIDAAHIARKTFFAMGRGLNLRALAPRSFAGLGGILMLHRVSPHVTGLPLGSMPVCRSRIGKFWMNCSRR